MLQPAEIKAKSKSAISFPNCGNVECDALAQESGKYHQQHFARGGEQHMQRKAFRKQK